MPRPASRARTIAVERSATRSLAILADSRPSRWCNRTDPEVSVALGVVDRLCAHVGVDRARIDVEHGEADDDHETMSADVPIHSASQGAAGHHRTRNGRSVIGIRDDQAQRPIALVATVAHELGHVLLLGGGLITNDREDHEPLTDLLTVYFGLGIFSANAAFEFSQEDRGRYSYTRTNRLGYLTEPMYGYGLARFAWLRGESRPSWARYLDTNPGTFLKRGLRYLEESAPPADRT